MATERLDPAIKPMIEHFFSQFNKLIDQLNDRPEQEKLLDILNGI
jgi:hypothetical protein